MKEIELARLYQLTYVTNKVECYKRDDISSNAQKGNFHEANAHGNALMVSGDIEIFFFWRAKSDYRNFTIAPEYQIEIDDSGLVTADINRRVIGVNGKELNHHDTACILVSLIKRQIGWIAAIDDQLTTPRLQLVKSA